MAVDYLLWIGIFLLNSLFWCWILFWGGAERLEGSFLAALLVHFRASRWSSEGIRLFALLSWLISAFWFVVGLFSSEVRHFGL
jgi:hypothetical protein